jgi:dTDP-4-amino-4,6-dideoxygalactose transaminase
MVTEPVVTQKQIPLLDLLTQHTQIREEVLAAITRVIDSQKFILGAELEAFECEVADYCETNFAVGCASGTDALILALMAAGVAPGDQVITTPYSFFATAGAIAHLGAIPVFADVDPTTFNIDPARAAEAVARSPRARAIIAVHLYGGCADMEPLCAIARERGLVLIEDAAQAIGAVYRGRRAGGIGQIGCFSFYPSKNLSAYGEGGLLTTQDAQVAARLRALRVHGSTEKYVHQWVGINSRLDALQAAVLRVKLRHLDAWTERRQSNARLYQDLLANAPVDLPRPAPYQTRHVFNQFVIRTRERDAVRHHLASHGVGTEVYYPMPLHLQPCFSSLGYRSGDFPVSEALAYETLALPIYPELSEDDIAYVSGLLTQRHP